jgi:hypothetical protein
MSAGPTAAALVQELEAHMGLLLADPAPLINAPDHFLTYWRALLARLQDLIDHPQGGTRSPQKGA